MTVLCRADVNLVHYCVTHSVITRSICITADVAVYAPPTDVSLQNLMMYVLLSEMLFLRFNTNIDYGYVYENWTCLLVFLHYHFPYDVFDSVNEI